MRARVADGSAPAPLRLHLDRAFALTTDYLVGLGPAPVDEVLERLEVELGRQGDAARGLLERRRTDAVEEFVERLTLVALRLVELDPDLDRIRHALGGQTHLQAGAVLQVAAFEASTDV